MGPYSRAARASPLTALTFPDKVSVMGDGELDRRVRRTLTHLREAIVDLVDDKGYQAVTVEHICERAEVTRATIYAHIRDKEHLLSSVADGLVDDCLQVLAEAGFETDHHGERLVVLFEQARGHEVAFRLVLRGEGDGTALRRLRQRLGEIVAEAVATTVAELRCSPVVPLELVAELVTGEILAVLGWWIEHDEPATDARQTVAWLRATSLYGRLWALGIDDETLTTRPAAALRDGLPPRENP